MTVESAKLYDFAVELKAVIREARASKAKAALILVEEVSFAQQPYADAVQIGVLEVPQFHGRQGAKSDRVSRGAGMSRGVRVSRGTGVWRWLRVCRWLGARSKSRNPQR